MVNHLYVWFKGALILGAAAVSVLAIRAGIFQFQASNQSVSSLSVVSRPAPPAIAFPVSSAKRFLPNSAGHVKGPMNLDEVMQLIDEAAVRHGVPSAFVRSIVAAESNFKSDAVSLKGAIGLMQLMPETAQMLAANPNVPAQNVDAGTHYLRILIDRYQRHSNWLPRVIAAYNAGPGMVDKYHGVPPFRETRVYVGRVMTFFQYFTSSCGSCPCFAVLRPNTVCQLDSMIKPQALRRRRGQITRFYSQT